MAKSARGIPSGTTPSRRRANPAPPSTAAVIAVCLSEILGVASYSIVPALLPQFLDDWSLSGAEGGWLAGMVFAGYMIAVLPLVSITDRVPARTVYLVASVLNVISCFGFALADGLVLGLLFRALAGIALAGTYMPGLRALTDGLDGPRRARVSAFYISSFTIGASLSFLLGRAGIIFGWRTVFVAAGAARHPGCRLGLEGAAARCASRSVCLQAAFRVGRRPARPRGRHPDHRLRRGHLGFVRAAAVDRSLSDVLCRDWRRTSARRGGSLLPA